MITNKLVIKFPAAVVEQPLISQLVRKYDLIVNILKADISPQREGSVIMEVNGTREQYQEGMSFLKELGVSVQPLNQTIVRNELKCTQCGACTAVCPVGALSLEHPSMEVCFDIQRCVVCGSCVRYCPFKAMRSDLTS